MFRPIGHRTQTVFLTVLFFFLYSAAISFAAEMSLRSSKDYRQFQSRVLKQLSVPRFYHEGLYFDGKALWLCNGEGGRTWVIDTVAGNVLSEITPVAGFTEAITARGDGTYFTTEWDEKKIYRVKLEGKSLIPETCLSVEPAHPAGIIWNGEKLFVVTWNRSLLGTKFFILEMDETMKVVNRVSVTNPQEPDHLAWDGKNLWLTSWFDQRVYKIDVGTWEILGYFCSPVKKTTGVAWDGKNLWITGTYDDLYQMEVDDQEEA